jgi:homoserine kinase type II
MGIKTEITSTDLPKRYRKYELIPTVNGVMASVYLLDNVYVLKLFELDTPLLMIESEVKLLSELKDIAVPAIIDRFLINGHEVLIYTQIKGDNHFNCNSNDVSEIGRFLKEFHLQSRCLKVEAEDLFCKSRLLPLIESTGNKRLKKYYNLITLSLMEDGVIHGDLFPDNCKFIGDKLSGVYDFSDACMGDFHFELAVVIIAWCFDDNTLNMIRVNALLNAYQSTRSTDNLMEYIKYALLYYATTRFIAGRDYQELLDRLEYL